MRSKSERFRVAQALREITPASWAEAFRLATGGHVRGDDLYQYLAYHANVSASPYLFGRPSSSFRD